MNCVRSKDAHKQLVRTSLSVAVKMKLHHYVDVAFGTKAVDQYHLLVFVYYERAHSLQLTSNLTKNGLLGW